EVGGGVGLEGGDANVAVARLRHPGADAGDADGLAGDRHVERFGAAVAGDREHHPGAGLAAEGTLAILARLQRLAVHRVDLVPRLQARAFGWRAVDRRDHHDGAVGLRLHFHAD